MCNPQEQGAAGETGERSSTGQQDIRVGLRRRDLPNGVLSGSGSWAHRLGETSLRSCTLVTAALAFLLLIMGSCETGLAGWSEEISVLINYPAYQANGLGVDPWLLNGPS